MTTLPSSAPCRTPRQFRSRHREASLNWIALGLLLAAWNAADSLDAAATATDQPAVKGHKSVNVL